MAAHRRPQDDKLTALPRGSRHAVPRELERPSARLGPALHPRPHPRHSSFRAESYRLPASAGRWGERHQVPTSLNKRELAAGFYKQPPAVGPAAAIHHEHHPGDVDGCGEVGPDQHGAGRTSSSGLRRGGHTRVFTAVNHTAGSAIGSQLHESPMPVQVRRLLSAMMRLARSTGTCGKHTEHQ